MPTALEQRITAPGPKKILACDGGGILGLMSVEILARLEADLRSEKMNYKIREAQSQKIPYMLVLGDKEAENDTISVRTLSGEQSVESLADFIARLQADVKSRKS